MCTEGKNQVPNRSVLCIQSSLPLLHLCLHIYLFFTLCWSNRGPGALEWWSQDSTRWVFSENHVLNTKKWCKVLEEQRLFISGLFCSCFCTFFVTDIKASNLQFVLTDIRNWWQSECSTKTNLKKLLNDFVKLYLIWRNAWLHSCSLQYVASMLQRYILYIYPSVYSGVLSEKHQGRSASLLQSSDSLLPPWTFTLRFPAAQPQRTHGGD